MRLDNKRTISSTYSTVKIPENINNTRISLDILALSQLMLITKNHSTGQKESGSLSLITSTTLYIDA